MQRIWIIDVARTLALIGMAAFHLVYDLQMFGVLPPGTATSGVFYYHARIVAGSFLFLAGMGLWLAHGSGLHRHAFWRRWLRIAAAAAGVTLVTRLAMPQAWVFFGILHCIALASLIALPCLRQPALLTLALGATVLGAAWWAPPLLEWTWPPLRFLGLQTGPTYSVDFVPLVPWFGPFLIGLGLARLIGPGWVRLARLQGPDWLAWPGRHSLAIYLLHQPVLIGLLWLILRLV